MKKPVYTQRNLWAAMMNALRIPDNQGLYNLKAQNGGSIEGPEEGFRPLVESGIYTPEGKLAKEYGGHDR